MAMIKLHSFGQSLSLLATYF